MIGLAASPLTRSADAVLACADRWDWFVYKTVSSTPRAGYPEPHTQRAGIDALLNSVGLPSPAPDVWMDDVRRAKTGLAAHQRLWLSVADTEAALLASQLPVDGIELNASCPNAATAFQWDALAHAAQSVPCYLKIGFMERDELRTLLGRLPWLSGVTAINTRRVSTNVFAGRTAAGLSGAPLREDALTMLDFLLELDVREVVSSGGVLTPADVRARLERGARHVQVCTGALLNEAAFHDTA